METIKLLAGINDSLKGKLMVCDFRDMYFATIEMFKRPDCPVCGAKPAKPIREAERLIALCGRNTVNVNPSQPINISLGEIYEKLKRHYKVLVNSSLAIVLKYDGDIEVSLFNRGRMLIKNVRDKKSALNVYNNVVRKLGIQPQQTDREL